MFIADSDNVVKRVPVSTGLEIADQIEIVEGLEGGEQVVIRGFTNLRENKAVKIVNAPAARQAMPASTKQITSQ